MVRMHRFGRLVGALGAFAGPALFASPVDGADHWRQWGGPTSDFKIDSPPLAETWGKDGPKRIWDRELGAGYSAIAYDDGLLFTMVRRGGDEVVIALDAATGKTRWEHNYPAPIHDKAYKEYGIGPRAMPTVAGDRVLSVGINGTLLCLDKRTGRPIWSKELVTKMGGTRLGFGSSASPITYKDTAICVVGGKGQALTAFDIQSGSVRWKALDFGASYATPLLIELGGKPQLVAFMGKEVIGVDPENGKLAWRIAHENQWQTNCTTPVWGDDGRLFVTTEQFGSRLLRLSRQGSETKVEPVWHKRKPSVQYQNAIRLGDTIYAACGTRVAPFTAINLGTGEVKWQSRAFAKPVCLYADGKFILLGEDGKLGLAKATDAGLDVLASFQLLGARSWAVPTLVGTRLYVRDQKRIMALELGK